MGKIKIRCFSTSFSKEPSMVSWISPLHYTKATSPKPDPPPTTTITQTLKNPKFISHESAIRLIKHEKDPYQILTIFKKVANQRGFNHNHSTYAITLHNLAHLKHFKEVDSVLHQMSYETCKFHESIFLDLMTHFSKSSLHTKVIDMFNSIQPIVREKPSLKAVSTCLNLLVESNQVDLARSFLLDSKKTLDLHPNTCIFNILVKHHCKNGNLESAIEVMKEMKLSKVPYPNLITYSTLMEGFCKNGRLEEAIDLFEQMVSKDRITPDPLTYNILINGFCKSGKVDRAMKIVNFMTKNGCNPNVFNYSTLINGFCKKEDLEEAKWVFNEMKDVGLRPDKIGYTTFINCLCRAGEIDEGIRVLKEMEEKDCKGDTITYNIILVGLCRFDRSYEAFEMLERLSYEGDLEKATRLVGVMASRGFVPHFATSSELVVRLCEGGRGDRAAAVVAVLVPMGFNPELSVWSRVVEPLRLCVGGEDCWILVHLEAICEPYAILGCGQLINFDLGSRWYCTIRCHCLQVQGDHHPSKPSILIAYSTHNTCMKSCTINILISVATEEPTSTTVAAKKAIIACTFFEIIRFRFLIELSAMRGYANAEIH
ncbi:hypothetical protein LXL04_031134 [Taraxacum kok-saghyz]